MSTLMYVKEDLIIPHHISFYDLIATRARGKSGPLFHFDVHEDIRLQNDARIEKDESHAGDSTSAPMLHALICGLPAQLRVIAQQMHSKLPQHVKLVGGEQRQ